MSSRILKTSVPFYANEHQSLQVSLLKSDCRLAQSCIGSDYMRLHKI